MHIYVVHIYVVHVCLHYDGDDYKVININLLVVLLSDL